MSREDDAWTLPQVGNAYRLANGKRVIVWGLHYDSEEQRCVIVEDAHGQMASVRLSTVARADDSPTRL